MKVLMRKVLRYSPYNQAVKKVIDSGVLGEIINIQVSFTSMIQT